MKALQFKSFGALELVELPTPQRDRDTALVQIKSASVNPSDVKNVSGHFAHTTLPRVPGRDFSGIVLEGPADWIGADVWGTGGDIGFTVDGTHAQFIKIPVSALAHKPPNLSHEQAAAIGVNFLVAWLGTVEYARLKAGETIAVIGAGGGVGGAVIQIAKSIGSRVIGIDRQPPNTESPAARLIDDFVIFDDSTVKNLRAIAGGVDVVFDSVGGIAFERALGLVKQRGRVVEISATGLRRVEFDLIDFYHNETQLFGADSAKLGVAAAAHFMAEIGRGFENGQFVAPLIEHRFTLDDARQAYELVAKGTRGRVVINM